MAQKWSRRKLQKYIRENDISKFKHRLRKYDIDVNEEKFKHNNSMLHIACENGSDVIVRYLLKCGANLLEQNSLGQVPLHLACFFALRGHRLAVDDLVYPLIAKCPASLDVCDKEDVTPGMLMERLRNQKEQRYKVNDLSSICCEGRESHEVDDNEEWLKKINEEMETEYGEGFGFSFAYSDDDDYASETYEQWTDRIAAEHSAKCQQDRKSASTSRKRTQIPKDSKYEMPKISEEKRKRFEKNAVNQREMERRKREQRDRICLTGAKLKYERCCDKLFKRESTTDGEINASFNRGHDSEDGAKSSSEFLGFGDIPWPYAPGDNLQSVERFLFGDLTKNSSEYKSYLKRQQVRWHPDRFLHRCGHRLIAREKERILTEVVAVCQILNGISEADK